MVAGQNSIVCVRDNVILDEEGANPIGSIAHARDCQMMPRWVVLQIKGETRSWAASHDALHNPGAVTIVAPPLDSARSKPRWG